MKNETALKEVETRSATTGQMRDIYGLAIQAVPTDLSFEVAQRVIGSKSEFIAQVRGLFPDPETIRDPLKQWEVLYREEFGETHDFSGLRIPEKQKGFGRLIIVAKGLTMNGVYDACVKRFPCWRYADDLDGNVPTNDRTPTEHYAIWVRDRVEADEELKNLSADDLAARNIKGVTLLERMLHELKYFLETWKHLDIQNVTLCSGSRNADGCVPSAGWGGGEFGVGWGYRGDRLPSLRSRQAVTP
ncbi:MAG: hypothetical protein Q7R88_01015 [bacterium]|nr:hypothetical protein [bacterium]